MTTPPGAVRELMSWILRTPFMLVALADKLVPLLISLLRQCSRVEENVTTSLPLYPTSR